MPSCLLTPLDHRKMYAEPLWNPPFDMLSKNVTPVSKNALLNIQGCDIRTGFRNFQWCWCWRTPCSKLDTKIVIIRFLVNPTKSLSFSVELMTKQAERVRPLEMISERINKRWRNADDQSCECREGEMRRFLRKWSHFDRAPFSAGGGVRRTNFFSCSQPTEKLRSILGTFAPGHPAMLTSGLNIS
jgi:hypothetical protein